MFIFSSLVFALVYLYVHVLFLIVFVAELAKLYMMTSFNHSTLVSLMVLILSETSRFSAYSS